MFLRVIKFFFSAAPTRWGKREIFLRPPCHCPGEKKILQSSCTYAPILFTLHHPLHQHHGHHLNSQKTPSVRVSSSSARDQQGIRVESRSSTLGRQTHRSAKQWKPWKRWKRLESNHDKELLFQSSSKHGKHLSSSWERKQRPW